MASIFYAFQPSSYVKYIFSMSLLVILQIVSTVFPGEEATASAHAAMFQAASTNVSLFQTDEAVSQQCPFWGLKTASFRLKWYSYVLIIEDLC